MTLPVQMQPIAIIDDVENEELMAALKDIADKVD